MTTTAPPAPAPAPEQTTTKPKKRAGDVVFSGTALGAGIVILAVLAAVTFFLIAQSIPAFTDDPEETQFLNGTPFLAYVWPFVFGTLSADYSPCDAADHPEPHHLDDLLENHVSHQLQS